MLGDMMGKLQAAQQKMEEVKNRLDAITVVGEAQGVKVVVNGNKVITNIDISQMIVDDSDKEQIEELLLLAVNRGLESADNVAQAENASAMKGVLPNIPGMEF
jgi:DNA-binding YbaB/EbfC family protein